MNTQGQPSGGDYGDKGTYYHLPRRLRPSNADSFKIAAAFVNKRTGGHIKDKNVLEKITDGLRSLYEKVTG